MTESGISMEFHLGARKIVTTKSRRPMRADGSWPGSDRVACYGLAPALYWSSLTFSIHSTTVPSRCSAIAM